MGDGGPGEHELMVTRDHGSREQEGEMNVLSVKSNVTRQGIEP